MKIEIHIDVLHKDQALEHLKVLFEQARDAVLDGYSVVGGTGPNYYKVTQIPEPPLTSSELRMFREFFGQKSDRKQTP